MTVFGSGGIVFLFSYKTINLLIINLTLKKMKKKDLLLENFETKLNKVNLKYICGGCQEIVQTSQMTFHVDGTASSMDPNTDAKNV